MEAGLKPGWCVARFFYQYQGDKVEERRKFVRVKKEIAVAYKVVATNANPRPGILEGEAPLKSANVSPGGMCLMVDKEFPVGTVLEVTLSFEDVQDKVVALSRVIWSKREDSSGGNFLVGLEYNAIRDGKMDESAQFGAEYLIDNHAEHP